MFDKLNQQAPPHPTGAIMVFDKIIRRCAVGNNGPASAHSWGWGGCVGCGKEVLLGQRSLSCPLGYERICDMGDDARKAKKLKRANQRQLNSIKAQKAKTLERVT